MGYWGFEDTTATFGQGVQVAASSQDASTAVQAVADAADAATTGSSVVQGALEDFEIDVNTARGRLVTQIDNLGHGTSGAAITGQQADDDAAAASNQTAALNRDVNAASRRALIS